MLSDRLRPGGVVVIRHCWFPYLPDSHDPEYLKDYNVFYLCDRLGHAQRHGLHPISMALIEAQARWMGVK